MPTVEQTFAAALAHHQARRLPEAESLYRQLLVAAPTHAPALHLLGVLLAQQKKHADAIPLIQQAIALVPGDPAFHSNLGIPLKALGRLSEAEAAYRTALALKSDYAEAHNNLGNILKDLGRLDEAAACCQEAVRLRPDYVDAWNNLANALQSLWKLDDAVAAYHRALALRPAVPELHHNLGNALKSQGNLDDAIACYREALRLKPDYAEAHSSLIFAAHYHPEWDSARLSEEQQAYRRQHADPLLPTIRPHANDRSPDRKLKVAYISPDLRGHAVALFFLPLLAAHSRDDFEWFCYADVLAPDDVTDRIKAHAHQWRNILGMPDEQVADLLRADGIDILIDLTMHMARNRLRLFARRPAPLQLTWLAYPGSTGLTTIDYRLSDPNLDPPTLPNDEPFYSERTYRLPDTFWCYHPLMATGETLPVNPLPADMNGYITFGSLNNFCKINDPLLALWSRVLVAVPNSRLMLLAGEGSHRDRTRRFLADQGVSPDRISFSTYQPRPKYLQAYHQIDLGLDTLPYNGHTTSLDSFWMGVPVVTLVGNRIVGRGGLCMLNNLHLKELIAHTPDEFVEIATALAHDLPQLRTLRATLRQKIESSPLMSMPTFAKNMESAYRTLWQKWCADNPR